MLILLLCGEWIILFRAYLGPTTLFMATLGALFRFWGYGVLPHRMGIAFLGMVVIMAWLKHIQFQFRRRGFQIPEIGVPWLQVITKRPKPAMFLELVVVVLFVQFTETTPLGVSSMEVFPPGFVNWVMSRPYAVAGEYSYLALVGLVLWNAINGRVEKEPAQVGGVKYMLVKVESHRAPRLASVKELMDQIAD